MNIFSNFLCKHKESEVICWHWTHGPNGNEIRYLEIQRKCKKCGKLFFRYIKKWTSAKNLRKNTLTKNGLLRVNRFYSINCEKIERPPDLQTQ